jgi:hypothetical protein
MTATPERIAALLAKANPRYREGHELNRRHSLVGQCRLGTVFVDQAGDLCIYTGIDGGNRVFPVMFTRIHDGATRKWRREYLAKIVAASKADGEVA